jgi:transposase InsO family protein
MMMMTVPSHSHLMLVSAPISRLTPSSDTSPAPLICLHDKGTEFTGIEFQEFLQSYNITPRITSSANPQTNAILERTHQVIANQLRSLKLMAIHLQMLANIQQDLLAPVSNGLSMQPSIQSFKQCMLNLPFTVT